MKLQEIYELAVEMGKTGDVRCESLKTFEQDQKEYYEKLPEDKKTGFDWEKLRNPYSDTRILYGDKQEEIKNIFCGIDIEVQELLLADRLREKGIAVDLALAHHPEGAALARLHEVMHVQEDLLIRAGISVNMAEGLMASRISEVKRNLLPLNHQRAVDAARLLDIPFMCVHSPADNLADNYLEKHFQAASYKTVDDIIDLLLKIPEYEAAKMHKTGPMIINGKGKNKAGRVFFKMTGGTGGPETVFPKLAQAGVGTFVCMHMQEKLRKAAQEHHINVIVAGHMASDSLGMNIFLDRLEAEGVNIIPAAGLIRIRRSSPE